MAKVEWKAGNMLYPVPVVLVSVSDGNGNDNVLTIAWAGTICSDPAMLSISVRPERHSHKMLMDTMEFVVNLTTRDIVFETDYCGVKSGRNEDKFASMKFTKEKATYVKAPLIKESPVSLECKVIKVEQLGTHDMFIAEIVAVHVDEKYLDKNGKFSLQDANPIAYSHGEYFDLGDKLGSYGYSVKKK